MRQYFRELPRQSQVFTVVLACSYLVMAVWGFSHCRLAAWAGLIVIFASTGLVRPVPNPTGGQIFPTNSVKIVAALLWQPQEVLIGVGLGSFLGLLLFRRTEAWRATNNGAGWGLSSAVASFAAQLAISKMQPGLAGLMVAALIAVATNRVINEGIFSIDKNLRFGHPFFATWLQNVLDQWFSQILAASMAIVLAAIAGRIDNIWASLVLTTISAIALPIPRQELAYYHRARQMQDEIVEAVVRALEGVDPTARAHGDRVSALAVEIGRQLGMSTRALVALRLASRLHDVGLLAGRQDSSVEERHGAIGARILGRFPDPLIAEFVGAHHTRWDGVGEPDKKQGRTIPLGARILAAAEVYHSALEGRPPFPSSLSKQEAANSLVALGGTVLDPQVVAALLHVVSEQQTDLGAAG